MWKRLLRVLNNKTVMLRLLVTFLILFGFRILSHLTLPLVNLSTNPFDNAGGFLDILNNYSGQALERFSILALGISPYITASIVLQMLQMVVPAFKEWSGQGEEGKQKMNKVTRYLAVALAFIQGMVFIFGFNEQILKPELMDNGFYYVYISLVIAAGTAIAIFTADLISKFGIGNGSSMLIVAGIVTSLPRLIGGLWTLYIKGGTNFGKVMIFIFLMLLYVAIILGVVFMQGAKRKVPIFYANRQGKSDTHIPIRINSAGVIPVIFASTILSIPLTIAGFVSPDSAGGNWIRQIFSYDEPIGFILYVVLIIIFSFFYSFLTIDPAKMAEDLSAKKANVKSVRPGEDTKNYFSRLLFKITVIGTVYLVVLATIPIIITWIFNFGEFKGAIQIGGTSLLIVVGVAIETTQQIESDAEQDEYGTVKSFLN